MDVQEFKINAEVDMVKPKSLRERLRALDAMDYYITPHTPNPLGPWDLFIYAYKQWANRKGRADRAEMLALAGVGGTLQGLVLVIFAIVSILLATIVLALGDSPMMGFIVAGGVVLGSFVMIVPAICTAIRRLHDVGKSGFEILKRVLALVALVICYGVGAYNIQSGWVMIGLGILSIAYMVYGWLLLKMLFFDEGDAGLNDYGPPKDYRDVYENIYGHRHVSESLIDTLEAIPNISSATDEELLYIIHNRGHLRHTIWGYVNMFQSQYYLYLKDWKLQVLYSILSSLSSRGGAVGSAIILSQVLMTSSGGGAEPGVYLAGGAAAIVLLWTFVDLFRMKGLVKKSNVETCIELLGEARWVLPQRGERTPIEVAHYMNGRKQWNYAYIALFSGAHYLYMNRLSRYFAFVLTFGGLGIWALFDLCTFYKDVALHNERYMEAGGINKPETV